MEIRDPIHGSIRINEGELRILDTPHLQRLRNIKQLGFADLAFPGATHSRYLHSIGTMELASHAFDSIFEHHVFKRPQLAAHFRQAVRLAALLHDIGHAPLSHSTESAMPLLQALGMGHLLGREVDPERRATHEDYGLKIIADSALAEVVSASFSDFSPRHVAALVNLNVPLDDDFFIDENIDYRTVLSQIVSSELDVDRMDYLRRDSYFAGVGYGIFDFDWIFTNLTYHVTKSGHAHLALDPRALYAFNDFLIARFHMFLMVYFHHKPVVFEEMLRRYFDSAEASYAIPADIDEYVHIDDFHLYHHLREEAAAGHPWARRIIDRDPYRLLHEWHDRPEEIDLQPYIDLLRAEDVDFIETSSTGAISKYTKPAKRLREGPTIYSVEKAPTSVRQRGGARPLEHCTDLFEKYEEQRQISRIYVPYEDLDRSISILSRI